MLCAIVALHCADVAHARGADHLLAPESVCPGQADTSLSPRAAVAVMRCMHNYARRKAGRRALRPLQSLEWSARQKADDLLACGEFSHTACGRGVLYWVRRTHFVRHCYRIKENIAWRRPAAGTIRLVMRGLLHSAPHRRALLLRAHRWLGIGRAEGSFLGLANTAVWVFHFGHRC